MLNLIGSQKDIEKVGEIRRKLSEYAEVALIDYVSNDTEYSQKMAELESAMDSIRLAKNWIEIFNVYDFGKYAVKRFAQSGSLLEKEEDQEDVEFLSQFPDVEKVSRSIKSIIDQFRRNIPSKASAERDAFIDLAKHMDKNPYQYSQDPAAFLLQIKSMISSRGRLQRKTKEEVEYYQDQVRQYGPSGNLKKELLEDLRSPFYSYRAASSGYARRHYDHASEDFTFGSSSPASSSLQYKDEMQTTEDAISFRNRYFPAYIAALESLLQEAMQVQ